VNDENIKAKTAVQKGNIDNIREKTDADKGDTDEELLTTN